MASSPPERRHRGGWIYNPDVSRGLGSNISNPSGVTATVSDPFGEAWIAAASKASRGLDMGNSAAIVPSATNAVDPGASRSSKAVISTGASTEDQTNSHTTNGYWQSEDFGSSHQNNTFSTANALTVLARPREDGPADSINTSPDLVLACNRDAQALAATNAIGISPQYQGDLSIPENWSADISPHQSTSLYIRGLHPTVTISQILASIRATGKIYSLFVNPPLEFQFHPASAAKLCFFTRAAAEAFYNATRGGFWVMGRCATVIWNRILVPEHSGPRWDGASRVIIIGGPDNVVNTKAIFRIIDEHVRQYDLDQMTEKACESAEGFREMELHFGSFRAQAHSAMVVLTRELRGSGVRIQYGTDPCE